MYQNVGPSRPHPSHILYCIIPYSIIPYLYILYYILYIHSTVCVIYNHKFWVVIYAKCISFFKCIIIKILTSTFYLRWNLIQFVLVRFFIGQKLDEETDTFRNLSHFEWEEIDVAAEWWESTKISKKGTERAVRRRKSVRRSTYLCTPRHTMSTLRCRCGRIYDYRLRGQYTYMMYTTIVLLATAFF